MTQDELDSMVNTDMDELDTNSEVDETSQDRPTKANQQSSDDAHWPPPAPTEDNKMVHQLDDVTRESELKASEIFDIIEQIGDDMMASESRVGGIKEVLEENVAIMKLLHEKFPNIKTFEKLLVDNSEVLEGAKFEIDTLQNNGDQIMNIMDIMQYQDIHRQKIERVINVMRALSKYMNTLFSGQVDDSQRVSSAQHIYGDENTEDVMDNDEIEALLNSFGTN